MFPQSLKTWKACEQRERWDTVNCVNDAARAHFLFAFKALHSVKVRKQSCKPESFSPLHRWLITAWRKFFLDSANFNIANVWSEIQMLSDYVTGTLFEAYRTPLDYKSNWYNSKPFNQSHNYSITLFIFLSAWSCCISNSSLILNKSTFINPDEANNKSCDTSQRYLLIGRLGIL